MPYSSVKDVPKYVPAEKRNQWLEVFNSAYARAKKAGKSDEAAEKSAFRQANGVAGPGEANATAHGPAIMVMATAASAEAEPTAPEWIQVLPAGTFVGRDGRGPYELRNPQAVIEATLGQNMEGGIVIDYDHSSEFAAPEGRQSPAAGWMREFKQRKGQIWARVEWTPDGAAHVAAKHWKYLSPVFEYTENGKMVVTRILNAALTNNPNLELQPVAAARTGRTTMADQTSEVSLGEMEKALTKAFPGMSRAEIIQVIQYACELEENQGTGDDGDEPEPNGEEPGEEPADPTIHEEDYDMMAEDNEAMVDACARELHVGEGEPTQEEIDRAKRILGVVRVSVRAAAAARQRTERTQRTQQTAQDPTTRRTAVRPGATPTDREVMRLTTEVNRMNQERAEERATIAVDAAIAAKKIVPAQRAWAIGYATRDAEGFKQFVEKQPAIMTGQNPTATTTQTTTTNPTGAPQGLVETICAKMGLKTEDFVAHYEKRKDDPRSAAAMMRRHATAA